MRIVKLSSLSEKERKKVLEEQEERYQQNQSERKKIQEEANNNFFNKFGTGETQTSHTTTYQNILNAMESREAKKDFERRNGLTLWDQIKRIAGDTGRIGENTALGVDSGVKNAMNYMYASAENSRQRAMGTKRRDNLNKVMSSENLTEQEKKAYLATYKFNAKKSADTDFNKYGKGNIDLTQRPVVRNSDGSISTVRSMSFEEDGKEVLIPTVVNGKIVSNEEAIEHYHKTGEYLGKFDSIEEAEKYAQELHNQQEKLYTNPMNNIKIDVDKDKIRKILERNPLDDSIQGNEQKISENISKQENVVTKKLAELAPSVGNMGIGMAASAINPYLGTTYFTLSAAGSYMNDAKARGMTEDESITYGALMGALEGVTEMIGVENIKAGGQAIKGLVKGTGKQALKTATKETTKAGVKEALKQFGIGIADNFVQESIMEPLQEFTALSVAGKDKADFSNMGQRMLQSGIDGALTSIIMSGAEAGASTCTGLVEKVQNGEKVTQTEVQNAIKDAQTKGVDTTKLTEDSMSYWMNKAKDIINQNTDNQVINQETKIAQNGLSQEQNDAKTQTTNNLAKVRQFYDEDTYNQMKNFIETAPSEEALNQINEDIKTETKNRLEETYKSERFTESQDRKRTYAQYQRQNNTTGIEYNNEAVDNALDTVAPNKNGRRTVGQWKQVAEQIGLNSADLTKSQIDNIAYGSWFDLQPTKNITRYDNRTKENKSFEKFTSDDWINTIYESAKEQKLQKLDTELNQEQYSLAETQPQNNFKYEQSDNAKIDTFRQDASRYWDNSEKTTKLVNTIEKIINDKGYNIRLDDTLGDNVNGRIVTNQETGETEIVINPNSNRKGEFIIGHELTHAIETDEMTKLVKQRMEKDGELRNAVEDLKKLYGTDDINAEVLADISGQLFGNQEFINNLSVEKPNVFKRIYDAIVSLANKITGNSSEALFLKDLKNKWEKAYRENTNNIKEPQYSIGGEKSLNADIKKLNEAKNLKDKGVSVQDIYKQTGWYKSIDGKWKYEIDDSEFNIKDIKIKPNETYELSEILDAPELFEAYPELKKILVDFDDIQNKGEQYSRMGYEYITINNNLIDSHPSIKSNELLGIKNQNKVYSTLMHEIQHVIQDYEGFAKGASIEFWSNAMSDINRKYEWTQKDYKYFKEEIGLDKYEEKLFKDFKNKKITGSELVNSIDAYIEKKGYTEKFERLSKIQQDLLNKKYKLEGSDAGSLYYFTAGEIEARAVQDRINRNSEWKKENIPTEIAGAVFAEDYTDTNQKSSETTQAPTQDNQGRQLSKQQQEYFKDSKVRDDNGTLLTMYHSTDADFNEFTYDNMGKTGLAYGQGFYFTDSEKAKNAYGNKTKTVYLDIEKPMEIGKRTMSKAEYKTLIETINKETNGTIIADYGSIEDALMDYEYGGDDIDLVNGLKNVSGLSNKRFYNLLRDTLGYDGIKANNQTNGKDGNYWIAFNSNQIKNIDNKTPTTNPDIRYSKQNGKWQDYLEKNYKSEGTTTDLRDIRLPMKEKQEVKLPMKQENTQQTQEQNNNTKGETINWNEIERPENNQKFRKHYKSIIESSQTTAEAKSIAKDLMGTDTYVPETNKGQLAQADQRIMTSSPETELQSLLSRAMNGEKISSVDIAVGERLIQYFSKTGSKEQLQEAIQATAMAGTSAGQTVQALSMLNHQTPQGQATWIQRSVDKMNKELAKRKGGTITTDSDGNVQVINKQGKDITNKVDLFNLTPEMINKIMNSENQEQMYKNIDEVYEELGQQVPKNTLEKIDTWRYFSMLANIRTHARNMIGNVAMGKMQRVKDKLAGGIEDVVSKFNPELERTKTLRRADKKTKEFAKQDFKNADVQSRLELNENKYNPQSRLQNARRTFKSDVMENTLGRLFNLNDTLLEAEDGLGLKAGYQKALSDYITANKINVDNITDAQLSKARNYAIQQAKEATFHQANAIASAVTQFQNKNNVTKFFVDAVLPFKKTPMNVAKSGMEYSPLQIAKSATLDLVNLRKGKISINQYIDNLSKGMTGTGIALAGYALAKAGILKASGGDDKDKEKYDEEQGKQSYSIEIAGKTYSLDWLAPTGIPLFVGAETFKLFNQEETEKSTEKSSEEDRLKQAIRGASNLLNAGATAVNPMSEMSMISGLTNALASYNTSDNLGSLGNIMTNAGKSYVNQFFPTLMGQVAKTGDEYERTTKSTATGTIGKAVDQTINQVKAKIPGLRQTLPIKTDIWGKDVKQEVNLPLRAFNNFINPATVKDVSTDKVDAELNKLYDVNKNKDLLPDILTKTIQLNNQTYRLSNKEYAEATKNYGQNSYKLIGDFIKTSDYNNLTQEQKETAISNIYSYVKEQNKIEYAKKVNEDVKSSTLYDTMEEIKEKGGNQSEYLNYLSKTKGLEKESEKNKVLADSKYSNKTKEIIYTNGAGKDDKLYNNLLSKSDINMTEYLNYKNKVSEKAFKADKDKKGKTITGSAKNKLVKYLNSNVTGAGNRLLIAGNSYALSNSERQSLSTYINKIASTKDEKIEIYKQLDKNFVVNKGKVYMKVSKK